MCGILGVSDRSERTLRMLPTLALLMQTRGKDSWGGTDGQTVFKEAVAITEGFIDCHFEGPQVYHTRGASHGAVIDRNAHPFEYTDQRSGRRVVGVHNGHVSNWWDLDRRYPHRNCQVDSEHIFAALAERTALEELGGYGNIVWWEQSREGPLQGPFFSTWGPGDPSLHIGRLTSGEVVWASTRSSIETAARLADTAVDTWWKIEHGTKYELARNPDQSWGLFLRGGLAWATRPFCYHVQRTHIENAMGRYSARRPANDSRNWPNSAHPHLGYRPGGATTVTHGGKGTERSTTCATRTCRNFLKNLRGLVCRMCVKETARQLGLRSKREVSA